MLNKSDPRHFWPNCPLLPTLRGVGGGGGGGEGGERENYTEECQINPSR